MMNTKNYALRILLMAATAAAIGLSAMPALAEKPDLPPGMAKYIMVLWTDGMPLPDGKIMKNVKEPDVKKHGGKVLSSKDNRREILLPKGVSKQLRKDPAVVFLQRVWMGEAMDDWDERYEENSRGIAAQADTNIDWDRAFAYDKSGNIKQFGDDVYTYDSAGRIVSAEVGDKTETFKYDDYGNLVEKAVGGANPVVIAVDPSSNRMTGPEYDAAGNVTTNNGRQAYEYDAANMLTRVKTSLLGYTRRMIYDADDERLGMLVDGDSLTRWTIRGFDGKVIREFKGDMAAEGPWTWELDEIYADGVLVAGDKQPFQWFENGAIYGGFRHYHLDHLGSVRVVTTQSGDSISEHEYYPYGLTKTRTYQEQINWGDPHLDSMRFAGHWRDFLGLLNVENTEYLDYMHARYYDPNLGRFLSVDPEFDLEKMLGNPQMWNRYTYVTDNPLRYVDPTGRASKEKKDKELAEAAKAAIKEAGEDADPLVIANLMIQKLGDFRASGKDIMNALKGAKLELGKQGWDMLSKVYSVNVETRNKVRHVTVNMTKPFSIPVPDYPDVNIGKKVEGRLEATRTKISFKEITGISFVGGLGKISAVYAETQAKGKDRIIQPSAVIKVIGIPKRLELKPYKIP